MARRAPDPRLPPPRSSSSRATVPDRRSSFSRDPASRKFASSFLAVLIAILFPSVGAAAANGYELRKDQVYAERGSGPLRGDLYLPAAAGPVPAVVMIHGGGWRDGDTSHMKRFAGRVAESGFAVFNITYRLAPEHKFPAQLQDVRDAVRWLRGRAAELGIDPGRIGAWGYSAGAHLAMLLGTLDDNALDDSAAPGSPGARVAAVVAGAGPVDLRQYPDNHYVADLMPANASDDLFALASPIVSVTSDDAPTFLYHGKRDSIVGFHNSVSMRRALEDAGVEARLHELRWGHIFSYLFGDSAVKAGIEFLRRHLGTGPDSS